MSTHSAKGSGEWGELTSTIEELQNVMDYVYADTALLTRTQEDAMASQADADALDGISDSCTLLKASEYLVQSEKKG